MNRILVLLLAFLILTGCRTKALSIYKEKHTEKEITKSEKDSVFEQKMQAKVTELQLTRHELTELELITEKDSTGQSKMLEFERIRSPSSEKIIVRGGKVRIKISANTSEKITKKDTLQVNNTSVRTNISENKTTEKQIFKKEKEIKSTGFSFWTFTYWLILIALIFIAWRLKLFKLFAVIIMRFKRFLKNI